MVKGVHYRKFTVPVHITAGIGVTTCTHSVVLRHAEILLSGYGDSPGIPNNNKLLEYCSLMKEWSIVQISLVPRLSHVGGEKRAWYTLFAHAQFSQDFWEFGNFP